MRCEFVESGTFRTWRGYKRRAVLSRIIEIVHIRRMTCMPINRNMEKWGKESF